LVIRLGGPLPPISRQSSISPSSGPFWTNDGSLRPPRRAGHDGSVALDFCLCLSVEVWQNTHLLGKPNLDWCGWLPEFWPLSTFHGDLEPQINALIRYCIDEATFWSSGYFSVSKVTRSGGAFGSCSFRVGNGFVDDTDEYHRKDTLCYTNWTTPIGRFSVQYATKYLEWRAILWDATLSSKDRKSFSGWSSTSAAPQHTNHDCDAPVRFIRSSSCSDCLSLYVSDDMRDGAYSGCKGDSVHDKRSAWYVFRGVEWICA